MTKLQEAIDDLKTTILQDGFTPRLVDEIAQDHDIRPELLHRMFAEQTGQTPESYWIRTDLPRGEEIRQGLDELEKAQIQIAREYVTGQIRKSGLSQKQYRKKNGETAIIDIVAKVRKHPTVKELAKRQLALLAAMKNIKT